MSNRECQKGVAEVEEDCQWIEWYVALRLRVSFVVYAPWCIKSNQRCFPHSKNEVSECRMQPNFSSKGNYAKKRGGVQAVDECDRPKSLNWVDSVGTTVKTHGNWEDRAKKHRFRSGTEMKSGESTTPRDGMRKLPQPSLDRTIVYSDATQEGIGPYSILNHRSSEYSPLA